MKLLSFNIGIKIDNSKEVSDFINSDNFDIILFQESLRHFDEKVFDMYKVDMNIRNNISKDFKYSFFGPVWYADKINKGKEIVVDFNGYVEQGNQILSKFPIIKSQNHFFYGTYELKLDRSDFKENDHSRAILFSILNIDGKIVQIVNIHGTYSVNKKDNDRALLQCEKILELVKQNNLPTIIAGDFNLFPNTQSIALLNKEFTNLINEYNISSTRPDFKDNLDEGNNIVDYIFVNEKIKVNGFNVPNTNISDHFPLILDFDILD